MAVMHRLLTDAPKGVQLDHLNHDTLDNRRVNLCLVTHQENDVNRHGAYANSKTGIRGVSVHVTNTGIRYYYVFRCHITTCKAVKYFPLTDEGYAESQAFSAAHYAAAMKGPDEQQ